MNFKDIAMPSKSDNNGPSPYLKLADGEQITCLIAGEPYEFYGAWENGKLSIKDEGEEGAKFRFKINVIVSENGKLTPKIWDQGVMTYNTLKELHEEYDLTKTMLKIKRHGTGKDTEYVIMPMRKEIDKDTAKRISEVELHLLNPKERTNGDYKAMGKDHPLNSMKDEDWDTEEAPF